MYNSRPTRPTSGVGTGLSSSSDPIASIWDGWWPIARAWKPMGRPAVLPAATPVAAQEPDKLEAVDRVATQLPSLECHQVF